MSNFHTETHSCPRCKRKHKFEVSDIVPRQTFDIRCCGGQVVETRVIRKDARMTARAWDWTQTMWDRR
jgi:hypothetical protein